MTDNTAQESFPVITDEMVADMRARIGDPMPDHFEPWITEVTRDAIRHYAHGIGDDNPLWCDPDYARGTKFGDVIAPPSILFACTQAGGSVTGMPGIHAMWAGCEFTWHHPIRRNTAISNKAYLKDLIEHQTRFAGRAFQQIHHIDFFDEKGVLLAEMDNWMFRTERDAARESGTKYDSLKKKGRRKLTDADLKRVHDLYDAEEIRGATPRYWEDVAEGEALPTMAKGPMTVTGFIAYVQGWGGLYIRSNKLYYKQVKRLPALGIKDDWGIPDCPEAVHWRDDFATMVGAPGAYDYGPERASWMSHMLTNWIGDDGFLRKMKCAVRRHNPVGDILFFDGRVTRKFEENGRKLVEISVQALTDTGEESLNGSAVAELPTKS